MYLLFLDYELAKTASLFGVYMAASFKILPSANKLINVFQNINLLIPILSRMNSVKKKFDFKYFSKKKSVKALSIDISDLSFQYQSHILFKNINLFLKKGDILSVIGSSGSGKSTLLRIIAGLNNDYSGKISFNNSEEIQNLKNYFFRTPVW